MKNLQFIILLILTLMSCSKDDVTLTSHSDDSFFLNNNKAVMPVLVKGNTASKLFCITLHGGPGDSGIQSFSATNSFDKLEEDIAMVYFDQRCAGLAQGNCRATEMEISDFVDDIDKLIQVLQFRYGNDLSFFLLGHSWGATLALDYLINGNHKNLIKGCIQSNGSHSIPMVSKEEKKILLQFADEQIALGNSISKWESIRDTVIDADVDLFEDRIVIVEQCYKTIQPLIDAGVILQPSFKLDNFLYHLSNTFMTSNSIRINNNRPFYEKLLAYDISDQLNQIETPMGLFWGRYDLVHPPIMAETIFNLLGSTDKELFFFEQSHHAPMAHENILYQQKVSDFINLHK